MKGDGRGYCYLNEAQSKHTVVFLSASRLFSFLKNNFIQVLKIKKTAGWIIWNF